MSVVVVLPVKALDRAKTRLADSGVLPAERVALATGMLTDVLEALDHARLVDDVIVVTSDPRVEVLARTYGNQVIADDPDEGHSGAALRGIRWAVDDGAFHALLLAGDTPEIDGAEIDGVLEKLADGPDVVIVPDRHGSGTNALLLTPPDVIEPSFGPGSRERHERLAHDAGACVRSCELASLALDVDTAEDLAMLAGRLEHAPHEHAFYTRDALSQMQRP